MRLTAWLAGFRKFFIRPRRRALLFALLTLMAGLPLWYHLQSIYATYLVNELKRSTRADLSSSADALKAELNRRLGMAETIRTFTGAELESNDGVDPLHLQSVLHGLYNSVEGIEFFSLEIPGSELILFPATAESGQSYLELTPLLKAATMGSPDEEGLSLLGPALILSGRRMLIARGVVPLQDQNQGITCTAFDLDLVLSSAGLAELPAGWGLVAENGRLLAGEGVEPALNPVRQVVSLPGTFWEFQAVPPEGWKKSVRLPLRLVQWGGLTILGLLAALVSTFINRQDRLRFSVAVKTHQLADELAERQRMTDALQKSEEQSRLIVESSLDAILIQDVQGRVIDCSEVACQVYGYTRPEMLELSVQNLMPSMAASNLSQLNALPGLDEDEFTQSYGLRKNGEIFPAELNLRRVAYGGEPRVIVFVRDLSERRREQRMLAETELRYHSLLEILPEGILLMDLNGVILFCNQHAAELHEFSTPDELIGCRLLDLVHKESCSPAQEYLESVCSQGTLEQIQILLPRHDGSAFWVELNATLVPGLEDQAAYILGVERDITNRQQIEAQQRLQTTALDAAANGIVITDPQGIIRWVNRAFTQLTGYSKEEALGQNPRILNAGVQPDSFFVEMWGEISAGRVWSGRVVNRRKDGSLYTEEMTITPVVSTSGGNAPATVTHFIAIKQDVTEREKDESRQAAIAALTSALRLAVSRPEIIEIILTQTLEIMNCQGAALMMRHVEDGRLICEQGVGAWDNWRGIQVSGHSGATARVLESLTPFVENDVAHSKEPLLRRIFNHERAVVCVPIIVPLPVRAQMVSDLHHRPEQVMGVLWLGRDRPFMETEIRVLVSITDIAASAIQRAALYDETRQRLKRLMTIHALDMAVSTSLDVQVMLQELLHQLTGDLGVDAADVMLVSANGWMLNCIAARGLRLQPGCAPHEIRLGEGLAGRAALERKTQLQLAPIEEYPPVELERLAGEGIISRVALPMLAKGELKGVLEVFYRQQMEFDPEWLEYLETLAGQAAIAIDNAQLFDEAQRSRQELSVAYDITLEGWARALELRDRETEGHTRRASELTIRLGRRLGMSEDELIQVWRGAILHDIGKLGIPDDILSKPGALTAEEWEVMRQHPRLAYDLLSPIPYLAPALDIPYCHHEHWDGNGYPRRLKGEEIPLAARIFAVADVWDALRSNRTYRPAWDNATARAYIVKNSGTHFDPQVVEAFEHLLDEEILDD